MRKLLVLAACLAAGLAQAATFTKPEVTIDAPEGWVEVPAAVLQAFHDELNRQSPLEQLPKYDYAFQSAEGPPWLSYPYVLVKVTSTGRPAEHDLESMPSIDLGSKVHEQGDASSDPMRYDKAANVVWIRSKSNAAATVPVAGVSGMIPTERGFVELHGYAKESDFSRDLPAFRKIITGARIAPELRYQPRWSEPPEPVSGFDFKRLALILAGGALIGIFVGVYRRKRP